MKISNSKKELARIISENGGWREGAGFAWFQGYLGVRRQLNEVWFGEEGSEPEYVPDSGSFHCYWSMVVDKFPAAKFDNWHQAILSRAEYFHLYPAPDAKHKFCESVMRSIPDPSDKPTIEQLAADYRNAKNHAERKQQEADKAKTDADEALRKLEIAGVAAGLIVTPIAAKQEPELVIADWRDLRVGDVISVSGKWWEPDSEYTVDENDGSRDAPIRVGGYWALIGECSFKFIRRQ